MNASNLQKKLTFKSKVISKVEKFNRKHKALSFLGLAYAVVAITTYNFLFYFYRNGKRFTALACIILFFISSSSFSYPAMSMNISFASNAASEDDDVLGASRVLSDETVAESDAELVAETVVDSAVIEQENTDVNPDVAEIDNMASLNEILEATEQIDPEVLAAYGYTTESEEEVQQSEEPAEQEFSSDDWKIVLVNKQHPIPDDYSFELGTISGGMRCDDRIITPLLDMLKGARADGVNLIVCSPYRDIDRQTMLFSNKVGKYMDGGLSYMEAYNLASQAVTVPGSSEHQIGLAVDIITDGYSTLDEGFGETAAGKWLAENSSKYGFILRYPEGKEKITSIEYEPWHFRYVGVDAATVITDNDLCLEEFWNIYVD
ncbi:D-alanyl-D-alanine carboxypeptidase family protein [Butyrivibrio sp. CB08]|uniref:M15 family metallopeptidase n=1 Tax=Butyrivibrio sp. CB08 TaxID=2364879 RepID=UPI000EA987DC|nr:M15 family metallopeptidase [Butyrivibrio sp. CB08]RKM62388.1 D-alanyl-D-alanine carboxypeptidase family protein [Butyrivibrio sp. CB08]